MMKDIEVTRLTNKYAISDHRYKTAIERIFFIMNLEKKGKGLRRDFQN